jgi:hypothetical protein
MAQPQADDRDMVARAPQVFGRDSHCVTFKPGANDELAPAALNIGCAAP